jgi:hypothetical protein
VGGGLEVLRLGVGGRRELENRASQAGHRTAVLDLQAPAQREQKNALAALHRRLGEQDVRFDRYDLGYAVLW